MTLKLNTYLLFLLIALLYCSFTTKSENSHQNKIIAAVNSNNEFFHDSIIRDVPRGHPRLFLSQGNIEQLKKNIKSEEIKNCWARLITASQQTNARLPSMDTANKSNYNFQILKGAEANALLYLTTKNKSYGLKAIEMITDFYQTLQLPDTDVQGLLTRDIGRTILSGAIVYDWCYNLLSLNKKKAFIAKFKALSAKMEIGYPPVKMGGIVGHGSEAQLMRDLLGAGIAVYDEDPEIYNYCAGRFFNEYVPVRNFWYQSEAHHQGDSYGPYRYQWEMFATEIFSRMGQNNIFNPEQGKIPYEWIYMRRPDGQLLRDGDSYKSKYTPFGSYWGEPAPLLLAANYYHDPYLKYEFIKQYKNNSEVEDLWMVLFDDPGLKPNNFTSLPLTKYFPYPAGIMEARTSWDSGFKSNAVVAQMKIGGIYFANHQHLDAGSFQLYYKGGLAIESGIYQGKNGGYGSAHDLNYNKRTIAHNSLLIDDPQETFFFGTRQLANDAGQRFPDNGKEPQTFKELKEKDRAMAKVSAHYIGPDATAPEVSYISGDITNAYTDKAETVNRSFIFLNLKNTLHPAALIIFDKIISAKPDYRKTWLLHSVSEPVIAGNITTINRTDHGYSGKLVNTTLLPGKDNVNIEKIGGTGHEFEVKGVNYPEYPFQEKNSDESGAWRVQISPKKPSKLDYFLNVMQVMDMSQKTALPVEKINTPDAAGLKIGNKVVIFNKQDLKANAISFKLTSHTGKLKIFVAGLHEGVWKLIRPGKKQSLLTIDSNKCSAYFIGKGGSYKMKFLN